MHQHDLAGIEFGADVGEDPVIPGIGDDGGVANSEALVCDFGTQQAVVGQHRRSVPGRFTALGQVDERVHPGLEQNPQLLLGFLGFLGAGVLSGKQAPRNDPVAVHYRVERPGRGARCVAVRHGTLLWFGG